MIQQSTVWQNLISWTISWITQGKDVTLSLCHTFCNRLHLKEGVYVQVQNKVFKVHVIFKNENLEDFLEWKKLVKINLIGNHMPYFEHRKSTISLPPILQYIHCPNIYLNLRIKTDPVSAGADATVPVYVWFLGLSLGLVQTKKAWAWAWCKQKRPTYTVPLHPSTDSLCTVCKDSVSF